jgi:hypothetical protein
MSFCPQECANHYPGKQVTTQAEIDVPMDIWNNLTGKNYKIWRCDYCGFVWGEKLFVEEPAPYYSRSAIGYFEGDAGQQVWHLTPNLVLTDYPDRKKKIRRRSR